MDVSTRPGSNAHLTNLLQTPSHLFQFRFIKNYRWSGKCAAIHSQMSDLATEYFASAGETLRYLQDCVERFDLTEYVPMRENAACQV